MNKFLHRSLKDEVCRIKTIFLVFTISYLTRAILSLALPVAAQYEWISVFAHQFTFEVGYNFWDVIPLTIVMVFHLKKIKPVVENSNASLLLAYASSIDTQSPLSTKSMHLLSTTMLEDDPEFADILIMNQGMTKHRRTAELGEEEGDNETNPRNSRIGDMPDEELSSSGDEISVPSRSPVSTPGDSSSEEGVEKVTYPYIETNKFI